MPTDVDNITDEQIASIADRLTEEGRKVSPMTVRAEAGSGSVVAIAAALQRWREARSPDMPQQQAQTGLPDDLAETLVNVARRLWTVSRDETERASGQRLSAVSQRLSTALAERDEALVEFEKTGDEAAKNRQQMTEMSSALRASEESVARLREEFDAATARAQTAEARSEEAVRLASAEHVELESVKASLEEERRAKEALNAALAGKDEALARIAEERDQARQQYEQLNASLAGKDEALARIAEERDQAWQRHEQLNASLAGKDEALARIAEERDQARQQHEQLNASLAGKDEALARIAGERDQARQQHEQLNASLAGKDEALARIAEERDHARQQHEALGLVSQEKSAEAERLSQDANAAHARAQAAEAQASETLARVAALEAELNEARSALAAERESAAQRSAEVSAQRDQAERVGGELDEARKQISALMSEKAEQGAELARVSNDVNALRERAEAAEKNATDLAKRLVEKEQGEESELASLQRQFSAQAKAHSKAYDELRANAEQWVTYAKDLRQRLDVSNEKILFIDARSTGEVALMRRLAVELERLKPDHELVFREAQQKLIGDKMAQQLAQKGYRYDPATAVMSKIES
ncbi:Chromosome partition protein Smc [Caballeronia glebae]|uniref:Chromosome partition protein Smc n=1 Tax=Caballeronia glebae TaxID=1777143 RepID=A0A158B4Z1_9BURK|nr:DNA-binding protein [Caballeronia glebae]SAK64427.1 Chromosome partition protein Smc [Caballeronia glebae]